MGERFVWRFTAGGEIGWTVASTPHSRTSGLRGCSVRLPVGLQDQGVGLPDAPALAGINWALAWPQRPESRPRPITALLSTDTNWGPTMARARPIVVIYTYVGSGYSSCR